MGLRKFWFVFILVLAAFFFPVTAAAAPADDDKVVVGGAFDLIEGEVLDGDLIIFGGDVEVFEGASVAGDVTLVGGRLIIDGEVDGNITQVGGMLVIESNGYVHGDIFNTGGSLEQSEDARVDGIIQRGMPEVRFERNPPGTFGTFILDSFWNLFVVFALSALTVVIVLLWESRVEIVSEAIIKNPVMTGGTGLLFVGVAVPVLILILLTIILIPVSLVGFVVLAAAGGFGWAALSYEIGKRLAGLANQEWSSALTAGLGSILLGIIYIGVGQLPCLGWAMQAMVGLIGLGAVVLTRFGSESYLENRD